jgi:hypothetical protein
MYEYDVYADARRSMPRLREPLQAIDGEYFLVKSDILAHTMTFSTSKDSMSNLVTIPVSRVREILSINRNGGKVESILGEELEQQMEEPTFRTEEDSITRFDKSKKRKKRKGRNNNGHQNGQGEQSNKPQGDAQQKEQDAKPQPHKQEEQKGQEQSAQGQEREQGGERHHGQRNHFHRNRGNQGGNRNNKNRQNNQNKPKQE